MNATVKTEDTPVSHGENGISRMRTIGNELLDPHIYDDHGDPHRAALKDADASKKMSFRTWLAVFFLGFTFHPSLSFTILTVFAALVPMAIELEDSVANVSWMAPGCSLAGSVAFAIAGQLSDYLRRKNVLLFGQALLIVGHIIGATAHSVNQVIAAMTILGFGTLGLQWLPQTALGLVFISIGSLIPEEIGYVYTSDSIRAGVLNIPSGTAALGGVILGALVSKMKRIPVQLMVAVAIQTIFTAAMVLIPPRRVAMGLVFQFFANLSFSWLLTISYVTVGLHVPQRDIGLAYGLIGSSRFLGGAVGTAIFSTVLTNRAAVSIPARVATAATSKGFPADKVPSLLTALLSGSTTELPGIAPRVVQAATTAVKWGYSDAFKTTWLVSIPFGVVAFVTCIFFRDPSPYFTAHTAVTLQEERLQNRRSSNVGRGECIEIHEAARSDTKFE